MAAKVIMVQGTMSNSGKSFLTAALCRIFKQDGYKTAPFKSQNMALNSYITKDGLEIGRAQAMQAEAAGITPSVCMNPILLKPTSHCKSQVIVMGEVFRNLSAKEYYQNKTEMIPVIKEAFHCLQKEYDVIVIEGAGSPAEINLREHDIVNMGLAEMVDAPVILVGDIDRGGVFASLYGTLALLEPEERKRIKAMIINKFRGDVELLKPGLRLIEEKTKVAVAGVIPMGEIDLDEEDSLSDSLEVTKAGKGLDICVIRLPHLSNFTDFSAISRIQGVSLRYAKAAYQLGHPDLLILPGSKNTMADLKWVRETGIETVLWKLSDRQVPIIGICGGYQMLGRTLTDPYHVEHGGTMRGLSLLDAETVFLQEKTRTQITGNVSADCGILKGQNQNKVSGYEIHMGTTKSLGDCVPWICLEDGRMDGLVNEAGNVLGTYLHGIFDSSLFVTAIMEKLAEKKGICLGEVQDAESYKEKQYDLLADLVRSSLDMNAIYRILNKEV